MSKSYVSELQMSRCNAYLQARCPQSLEELYQMQRFYHYLHRGAYDCVEGNEVVEMRIDNTDCLQTEAWNYSMKILLEELEQLLLDVQTQSNTTPALDFSQEESNRINSHTGKRSHIRQTNIKGSLWNHDQNTSMCRQPYKTRIFVLDISQMSCDFNDDDLTVKKQFQSAHLLLKRIPDRYKHTKHNWKKFLNSQQKQNYLLCLHFDCPTLYVDIVVLDRQLYEKIHLEHISLTLCTTLAKALNENRAIESSDKNIRSHMRGTNSCADDRRTESSNHRETLRVKQGGCETEKSTDNVSKKRALGRGSCKRKSQWLFEPFKVLLILQAFLSSVCGAPFHTEPTVSHKEMVQSTPLLLTENCNHRTLYDLNQSCQTDQSLLKILIGNCQFKELCNSDEKPVCLNTQENIGVFICQKKNLKCAKGYTQRVWVDEKMPDVVNLQEQKCPEGSFQSLDIDCSYACYNMHRNLDHISEKYIVYSKGDNKSPTLVYCNYKKGYFRREEGNFLLDYDLEEEHNTYFCTHTNQFQPCTAHEFPLPNGTCTTPCQDKYFRDDHDGFKCKQVEEQQLPSSIFVTEVTIGNNHKVTELPKEADGSDHGDNGMSSKQWVVVVVVVLGIVVLSCLFIVGHTGVRSFCNRQSFTGPQDDTQEPHSGEGDESGVGSTNGTNSFDVSDENESSDTYEDNVCKKPLLRMTPSVESTVSTTAGANGNVQQDIVTTSDKCRVPGSHAAHIENMHVTQHNYFLTADQVAPGSLVQSRREHISDITVKDSSEEETECIVATDQKKLQETGVGANILADTGDMAFSPLPKENSFSKDSVSLDFVTRKQESDVMTKNRNDGENSSMAIFKGKEFKKDFDDTNTQAVHISLTDCLMSCGALVYKKKVAGSVFRVGTFFGMTAFHVIKAIIKDPTGNCDFDYSRLENSDDVTVNFNGSICESSRRKFRLKYRFHNEELDVAILEIMDIRRHDDIPKGLLLWQYPIVHSGVKRISVIGYGHASNPFEKHLETCELIQDLQERYMEALASLKQNRSGYINDLKKYGKDSSSVDPGYASLTCPEFIKFDCYMGKGLSGAPILTNEGNSTKVIGIVIGGLPEFYYELSEGKQASFEKRYLFEVGMKMEMIYKRIVSEDRPLAGQLFNGL